MKRLFLINFLLVALFGCDTNFKAVKVESENYSNEKIYETYLISNTSDLPKERYPVLINNVAKKRIQEIHKTNTDVIKFVAEFYRDVSCTRKYYENYESLKRVESIVERCEEFYSGSLTYERSTINDKYWYLVYPKNMKDTIYFK